MDITFFHIRTDISASEAIVKKTRGSYEEVLQAEQSKSSQLAIR